MNVKIEAKEAFEVLGIEWIFKSDEPNRADFWEESIHRKERNRVELFKQAEDRNHHIALGINNYYDGGENTSSYMICIPKEEGFKTDGYKTVMIPKFTWAVFHADVKDHNDNCMISPLFNQAYSEWLPSSG